VIRNAGGRHRAGPWPAAHPSRRRNDYDIAHEDPTARLAKFQPAPCQSVVTSSVTKSSFFAAKDRQIVDTACTIRTLLKISTKPVDNLVEKIGPADFNPGHLAIFKGLA
jgi:hypothetical protein